MNLIPNTQSQNTESSFTLNPFIIERKIYSFIFQWRSVAIPITQDYIIYSYLWWIIVVWLVFVFFCLEQRWIQTNLTSWWSFQLHLWHCLPLLLFIHSVCTISPRRCKTQTHDCVSVQSHCKKPSQWCLHVYFHTFSVGHLCPKMSFEKKARPCDTAHHQSG